MAPEVIACDQDPHATYDYRVSLLVSVCYFCIIVILFNISLTKVPKGFWVLASWQNFWRGQLEIFVVIIQVVIWVCLAVTSSKAKFFKHNTL